MRNVHEADKARRRLAVYNRDLEVSIKALEEYLEEIKEEDPFESMGMTLIEESPEAVPMPQTSKKVFISHASANKNIVGELIEILKQVGLRHGQIFCTSFPEYSIPLGVNYLDWLKKELTENSLVIFVLSHEFYKSPVCLSEMGATWALSKEHVPIFVPPFTYDESKGPFPLSQGMIVTEKFKYNELANMVERLFELPARGGDWERSRDTIITRIEGHVHAGIEAKRAKEQADAEERARPFKELSEMMERSREELATVNKKRQPGGLSRFEAI